MVRYENRSAQGEYQVYYSEMLIKEMKQWENSTTSA